MRIGMRRGLENSDDDENESESLRTLLVSTYHLVDDGDELVCFSELPILWKDSESFDFADNKGSAFLHGYSDNGLQKIFMQVIAWRFDLSRVEPEISLLSKDRRWIKLEKPRRSFLETVRTAIITIYFLHRVKKNPRMSAKGIWNNLTKNKDLSSYGFKPSRNDLLDHMPLIGEAAKRDAVLAQTELLLKVLEKPGNQKLSVEEVDDTDNDIINNANEDSNSEDDDLSNSVCSFCDNGGNLLCCDGGCSRSFHATKDDGREAFCDSLGFTKKEVDEIENFFCKNCEYHQHQCFACGKLGSSDKVNGAEVFKCATCDCFYHPHCISKLLPRVLKHVSEGFEKNIANGDPFTCPVHYCWVCKGLENQIEPELQFAVCRRCPKSYHRKCLPREIAFDSIDDEDVETRAWEGLLPNNRILIYCLNHEIDQELGTPIRDHIKFPNTRATVVKEINTTEKRMKPATEKRAILKKKSVDVDNLSGKSTAKGFNEPGKLSSSQVNNKKSSEKMVSGSDISMKRKSISSSGPTEYNTSISKRAKLSNCEKNKQPDGEKLCALTNKDSKRTKHDDRVNDVDNETLSVKPINSVLPPSDADSGRRNCEIGDKLGTPIRDHKKFHDTIEATVREINTSNKRMKPATKNRDLLRKSVASDSSSGKSAVKGSKVPGKLCSNKYGSKKLSEKVISGSDISTKLKSNEIPRSCLTENKKSMPKKVEMPNREENKQLTGAKFYAHVSKGFEQIKHDNQVDDVDYETLSIKPIRSVFPPSSASGRSLSDLFKEARSSILSEDMGNGDQEHHREHEYRMREFGKTSLKRKHTEDNDRTGLGVASLPKRRAVNGVQGPSAANPLSDCGVTNTKEHRKTGEGKHQRESDTRQEVEARNPNCDNLSGHDPSCGDIGRSLPHLSPVTEPSDKINTQAMQPYVSREDALNHVRTSSWGPKPPTFNRSDTSERCVSLPGFASGLNLAYSRTHSAGWLDE